MNKNDIDEKLPGDWTSVDASELFALFILSLLFILVAFGDLSLEYTLVKETIMVCLLVLFGSRYSKINSK